MSYILDALKKAEQERGLSKVPTLETVHRTPEKTHRVRLIVSIAVPVLVIGAGIYLITGSGDDRTGAEIRNPTETPEESVRLESHVAGTTPVSDKVGKEPVEKPKAELFTENKSTANTRAIPEPASNGSNFVESEENFDNSPQGEPASPRGTAAAFEDNDVSTESRTPSTEVTTARRNPAQTADLQQAVQGMTVSIHLYSSVPSNRMIFINGRKYAEGDYIEGLYLIESITPDGAVLTYQGARATLKATR